MSTIATSIIVLTYKQLEECTKPCIESLLQNTPAEEYELIVVDNASGDGTGEYLRTLEQQHSNIRAILNDTNKGFAAGNNDGIKVARGDYIVLLNSDTLLPPGWLKALLAPFDTDEKAGLIGPVSNSVGNEQCLELPGLTEKNYLEYALPWMKRHTGVTTQTEKLGFFCVAIRRSVLETIGMLDEEFGIGMFEDDDFSLKAAAAGFTLLINEGSFVYHKGSAAFKKMAQDAYLQLFRTNRKLFQKKHDRLWTFSQLTMGLVRKIRSDFNLLSAKTIEATPELERIGARLNGLEQCTWASNREEEWYILNGADNTLLEEKQLELMRLSDWATELKTSSDELAKWAIDLKEQTETLTRQLAEEKLNSHNMAAHVEKLEKENAQLLKAAANLK